jgi:peptidyl-prolyl cis-trans isomerase D
MLQFFRKNPYSLTKRVVLVLLGVVLTFFFGVGTYFARVRPVATVNCRTLLFGLVYLPGCQRIMPDEIDREAAQIRRVLQGRYGENASQMLQGINLRQMALEELIEQALITGMAKKLGLGISDHDLARTIESQAEFQNDGHFDVTRYNQVVRTYLDVEPAEFEQQTRDQMLVDTLRLMIAEAVKVSRDEARREFNRFGEKLSLAYIAFSYANFADGIKPSEQQLTSFYANNKDAFRQPELVKIGFIRYDPTALVGTATPSVSEIQDYYERNLKTVFTHPEQARARHILIQVAPDATAQQKTAAKTEADDLLRKLKAGTNFDDLAKRYSDDPGTKDNGGDLGYFKHGEMLKQIDDAVFKLKPGQLEIVRTSLGYHVIRLDDVKPAHIDTIEEARPKIIAALKEKSGSELARQYMDQDLTAALQGRALQDIANKRGLVAVETPYFGANASIKGAEDDPKLAAAAFKLQNGEIQAIKNGAVPYLVKLLDRKNARLPPFAEVRKDVRQMFIRNSAEAKAHEAASAVLKQIKSASDFDTVAAANHLEIRFTGEFPRAGRSVPEIGDFPQATEAAVMVPTLPGIIDKVLENQGTSFIFKVINRIPPTDEEWKREESAFVDRLLEQRRKNSWVNFVTDLKRRASINVNSDLLGASSENLPT